MIEKIYLSRLDASRGEWSALSFPALLRFCRNLMGLKQYSCADYLGIEQPRYKKVELGLFVDPLLGWELFRLQAFFQLDPIMLQKKHDYYLRLGSSASKRSLAYMWENMADMQVFGSEQSEGEASTV